MKSIWQESTFQNTNNDHSFGQDAKRSGESLTLIVITALMMVVEISTDIAFGSMALLADGMHMASHALALGINYFAYCRSACLVDWFRHLQRHCLGIGT